MRVRRRTLTLTLPVALILGIGACSPDEPHVEQAETTTPVEIDPPLETSPADEPDETPDPTATGPTPPARPAAMNDTGKKGAQAAAEYFVSLVQYTYLSGDITLLNENSYLATCGTCSAVIEDVNLYAESNYTTSWGTTELSEFEVSDRDQLTGGFAVTMAFSEPAGDVRTAAGEVVEEWEADEGWMQVDVMHDGEQWRTLALVTDQDDAE